MKLRLAILASILALLFFPYASSAQVIFPNRGGTGTTTAPSLGQVLVGCLNAQSQWVYCPRATSTLGISTSGGFATTSIDTEADLESILTDVLNVFTNNDGALDDDDLSDNTTTNLSEGTNLYYTNARVQTFLDTVSKGYFFSTTSADYWETQQTARTADDLTNNSIKDLSDVAAMTENYGDLLYWNGSAWADISTSSLGLPTFAYPFPGNATTTQITFSNGIIGNVTGNANTATALAANGGNCSSGNAPLGVDASGAVENCFDVWTEAENTSAAYAPQSRTLTVAGTANQITSSAGAQDLSANRTWTLSLPNLVLFPNAFRATYGTTSYASSTAISAPFISATVGSSTSLVVSGLNAANCDLKSDNQGNITCGTDATGGGGTSDEKWATSSDSVSIQPNVGQGLLVSASSTINRIHSVYATTSYATSTYASILGTASTSALNITSLSSRLLSTSASGGVQGTTVSSPLSFLAGTLSIQDAAADGATKGAASFTATDFNSSGGNISLDYANGQEATTGQDGFMTSGAWTLFNNKISSTSLSGASVISYTSGTGVITTTGGTFGAGNYVFPSNLTLSGTGSILTAPYASTTYVSATIASSTTGIFSSLLNGRVPYVTNAGQLTSDNGLTYTASPDRLSFTYGSTTMLTASGIASGTTLFASDFLANRVAYTTTAGQFTDSANLTFDGTTLTANALTLGTPLALSSGGTNATSFTTSGSVLYFNGTGLATVPTNAAATFPYASTTYITSSIASTTSLVVSGLNCTGANGGALTAIAGVITCSDDDGGAGGSSAASKWATTSDGLSITPSSALRVGIGTSSPWGLFSIASSTWGLNIADYVTPLLSVATTSDPISSLFNVFASTTVQVATAFFRTDSGARVSVGSAEQYGFPTPLDQFTVDGRINTTDWAYAACEIPHLAGNATSVANLNAACGNFNFREDTTGEYSTPQPTVSGLQYGVLTVPIVGQPGSGAMLTLYSPNGSNGMFGIASNTPVMEAVARINTPVNATSTMYVIGFGDLNVGGTAFTEPNAGCYFIASSTEANWYAKCKKSVTGGVTTAVDTGIASTSLSATTGAFYRFRIEFDALAARFYLQIGTSTMQKVATIADNSLSTTSTAGTGLHPAVYVANNSNRGLAKIFDVASIRLWWRRVLY